MVGLDILNTRRIDIGPLRTSTPTRRTSAGAGGADAPETSASFDFRVLFENAYDAVLVTSEHGRVLACNRRAQSFFRFNAETLATRELGELIVGVSPELLGSIVATAASRRFTVLQAWCQRADRTMFPAEIVVTGSVQGGQCTLFTQIRDATVRRGAEEHLLSITRALNTAALGIGTADLDGKVTYANPYLADKLRTTTQADVVGQPLDDFFGKTHICETVLAAIHENKVWSDEISLVQDGTVLWLQIDAAPHQDSEGVLAGFVFSVRDIGDRKRAEAAEYQMSRSRLMMESMSTACHLLGQPATVLLSCLEILESRQEPNPAEDAPLLRMVHEAAQEMRDLLQNMHAYAGSTQRSSAEVRPETTPSSTL
jgi:PAS domain S-box-containing protein